ncbi:hypothetical protein [Paraburkholderia sp. MM5477-R1]|uniref:hypothetical protein n=1 Tax=Paraburkholderia sp. MM5477-R1 TaxID=2991062 RepID=UPI003D201C50
MALLRSCPALRNVIADRFRNYPAGKVGILELANVKLVFVKMTIRVNNETENSPEPTRNRESRLRYPKRTELFLSCTEPNQQHLALKGATPHASLHRGQLATPFGTSFEIPKPPQLHPPDSEPPMAPESAYSPRFKQAVPLLCPFDPPESIVYAEHLSV